MLAETITPNAFRAMRRSTAKVAKFAGALGLVLALPLSFAAQPDAAGNAHASFLDFANSESVIDAWRNYALADLSSGFSWASTQSIAMTAPSLFDRGNARIVEPASRFSPSIVPSSSLQVTYLKTNISDTPLFVPAQAPQLLQDYTPGLQRYIVAPTLSQKWGDNSSLSFSAIFAYERFAGLGLGTDSVSVQDTAFGPPQPYGVRDSYGTYGIGMRADFTNALTERLSWQVGYQSRVNMDSFNNYRGVYSEPGSFDIPASANVGIGYSLTADLKLDAGVERVMYNSIAPFTSDALPTRFLALLGSEISPSFAWQNLDVYSVGWTFNDPTNSVWSLHYSTREQPLPTSRLLQSALQPYLSSHDIEFGFSHAFTENSNFRFAATYAPTEFVLGLPTSFSLRNGSDGNQIEYEAMWTTRF